jgi:hypothetical protein
LPVVHEGRGAIGPDGGIVRVSDPTSPLAGVAVVVPPGALEATVELAIVSPAVPLPFENDSTATAVQLEPPGLRFAVPVTVTLPWPRDALPSDPPAPFAWVAADRVWRPLPGCGVDPDRRVVDGVLDACAPVVAGVSRLELDATLVNDCGRIAAAIELRSPLAEVPTSPGTCRYEGVCDLAAQLDRDPAALVTRIEARLIDASVDVGAVLATQILEAGVVAADAGRYAVEVRDAAGGRLLLSPLVDRAGVERYLSGAAALCVFDGLQPVGGRLLAVEARLHHLARFGGRIDADRWCAHGLLGSTLLHPTTFEALPTASDVDCDGVVDAYDSEAQPACDVSPTELRFPDVPFGAAWDLRFWVENQGDGALRVDIASPSEAFELVAGSGAWTVTAGSIHEVVVRFSPVVAGEARCVIETGSGFCDDVTCVGASRDEPPGRIDDLRAVAVGSRAVDLAWTAPGEDGFEGTASRYDLRLATFAITEASWFYATPVTGLPVPSTAWTPESFTVGGLEPGIRYWLALRAADAASQWSELSPVVAVRPVAP